MLNNLNNLYPFLNQLNLNELKKELERKDFKTWCEKVTPQFIWDWNHLLLIDSYLEQITTGDINRLMFFMPPRHGKSEKVTTRYSAWRIECDPLLRVIVGAYNQTLANKFSRKAKRILSERIILSQERQAADDWETKEGGGMRAVGVGGGITGQGGNLIFIDDPVKSREEANSEVYREKVWDWYTDDLYTRLEPDGAIVLIMTRWHEDDLAGRILTSEDAKNWTVVRLPAFAESQTERDLFAEKYNLPIGENDPLNRKEGDPLCSERYDSELLESIKIVLGSYAFGALYQQTPSEPEGSIFKVEKIDIVKDYPRNAKLIRYWDKAGTKDGGAYTAGGLMARDNDGIFYICDMVRGQWSANEREKTMKQVAEMDGNNVQIWVEQEPGSGGLESADSTIKNLAGFIVRKDKVTGSKETRWEPLSAQVEAGNVKMVYGSWNKKMIDELRALPSGKYKDQADSLAGAFNKLAKFRVIEAGGSFQLRT